MGILKVLKDQQQSQIFQVVKYITNEVMKCSIGESFVMKGNLNCSYQGRYEWKDDVADAAVKALDNFKNPHDTSAASPITKGGQYWYDKDVGYVRIHTELIQNYKYGSVQRYLVEANHPNIYDAYTPIQ